MGRIPSLRATEVIRVLERVGFEVVRQRGSHVRLRNSQGSVVTVPVHQGQDIGRGLLAKILHYAEFSTDEFLRILHH